MPISINYIDGQNFQEWFSGLSARARAKAVKALRKLEVGQFEQLRTMGDIKALGGGLFEIRVHIEAGYRIYFFRDGNAAVISRVGSKATQQGDIDAARRIKSAYQRKHRAGRRGDRSG